MNFPFQRHNARIYEAADDIDCIQADVWSTLFQLGNPHRKNRLYEKLVKMIPKYNVYKYYPHGPTLETNTLSTEQGTNTSEDQGIPPVPTETRLPNDSITATVSNPSSKSQHRASGKADLIILSPPWGGPDYIHTNKFDLTTMLTFVPGFVGDEKKVEEKKADDTSEKDDILNVKDGMTLVLAASAVAENIVYIVPRNTSTVQLTMLANILALPYQIEEIVINHKPKVTVAYYGYLFKKYT